MTLEQFQSYRARQPSFESSKIVVDRLLLSCQTLYMTSKPLFWIIVAVLGIASTIYLSKFCV